MTVGVKAVSQLPLVSSVGLTDQIIVNKDNGDSTFSTSRVTSANFVNTSPSIISKIVGTKVNLTHASSPYAMGVSDEFIICDTTGGDIVIDLIGATLHQLPGVTIEMETGTGSVTMTPTGSDTISGPDIIVFQGSNFIYKSDLISKWRAT